MSTDNAGEGLREAVEALLRTASRPSVHSATGQVNAAALDRLRAVVAVTQTYADIETALGAVQCRDCSHPIFGTGKRPAGSSWCSCHE